MQEFASSKSAGAEGRCMNYCFMGYRAYGFLPARPVNSRLIQTTPMGHMINSERSLRILCLFRVH